MSDENKVPDETDLNAATEEVSPEQTADKETAEELSNEEQFAALLAELHQAREDRLRAIAEAENTRRRTQRELENSRKYAVEPLAKELLNIADNIKRALDAVDAEKADSDPDLKNLRAAVEVMDKDLASAFGKNGIAVLHPEGAAFDPNGHQAMFEVPTADAAPGTVVQVVTRGYQLHDRLLRPAMVGVAKAAG